MYSGCAGSQACRARPITGTLPDAAMRTDDCELRDLIQRICLKHRFYGYRRVTATLRRQGMVVNAKKVQRLMREDNLLAQRKVPFLKPPAEGLRAFSSCPIWCAASCRQRLIRSGLPTSPMCISQSLRLSCRHSRRLLAQGRGLGFGEHA